MSLRYPSLSDERFCGVEERKDAASFLGLAVLGNMRAFVFACNTILEQASGTTIGLSTMTDTLLSLATNHYWPLLEELEPKLGIYGPMIKPARRVAEILFTECGKISGARSVLVHRDITEALAKPLEILEYVGFISKRDASRAMKSGGRGARYAVNLCNLLEYTPGTRLTRELSDRWSKERIDPVELHRSHELMKVEIPTAGDSADLAILNEPIDKLRKSKTYPYGLTDEKITVLQGAEIATVGNLAEASDEDLLKLHYVGPGYVKRFRNVVGQAIWM
jgi:hypothetical protein